MIPTTFALAAICIMAAITVVLRATPFLASGLIKDRPIVASLGRFLPGTIMALLVFHSLYSASAVAFNWQAVVAAVAVVAVQLVVRRPLISIVAGTGFYMLLLNVTQGA